MSPALAGTFFTTNATWETHLILGYSLKKKKEEEEEERNTRNTRVGETRIRAMEKKIEPPSRRQKKGESGDRGDCL